MEGLIAYAVIAYLIYSFVSAIFQKQEKSDRELPSDDAPWPHLEKGEDPRPIDAASMEPSRPDPRGPGPIFWPDLFGDPTQAGAPHGWPTELPKREAEPVRQKEQKAVADSKKASEQPAASTIGAEAMPTGSMLAQAESTLRQRLGERERAEANDFPRQTAATAAKTPARQIEQQAPFELTPATLRQAILYTEVLGPPRALRPYRPPLWK